MPQDRADLVRRCFAACATKDRGLIEGILSDDKVYFGASYRDGRFVRKA